MLTYISNSTRVFCPRVHFKMLVFDGKEVYVVAQTLLESVLE